MTGTPWKYGRGQSGNRQCSQARLSSRLQISMGTDDGWERAKEHQQGSSVDGYAVSSARDLVSERNVDDGHDRIG